MVLPILAFCIPSTDRSRDWANERTRNLHLRAAVSGTRLISLPLSSNLSCLQLFIVTRINAELTLGWSEAAAESATARVTVPHVAWEPGCCPVAFSCLAGGFCVAALCSVFQAP